MKLWNRFFFSAYEKSEMSVQQKAKAFVLITSVGIMAILANLVSHLLAFTRPVTVIALIAAEVLFVVGLALVRRGRMVIAVHIVIAPANAVVWLLISRHLGHHDLVMVTDTVAYIFALITFVALTANRVSVVLYTAANIAALVLFCVYAESAGFISLVQMQDYLRDNIVSLVMVGTACFTVLHNSRKSTNAVKEALEESNRRGDSIRRILDETSSVAVQLASSTEATPTGATGSPTSRRSGGSGTSRPGTGSRKGRRPGSARSPGSPTRSPRGATARRRPAPRRRRRRSDGRSRPPSRATSRT